MFKAAKRTSQLFEANLPAGAEEELEQELDDLARTDILHAAVEHARTHATPRAWQIFHGLTFDKRKAADLAREHGVKVGAIYQARHRVMNLIKEKALEFDETSDDRDFSHE